jgi:hypothetical protein
VSGILRRFREDWTMTGLRQLPGAAKLSIASLVATAAGMLLQIAAGSVLYPSFAGPLVLITAAFIVAFLRGRWISWLALLVPLLLGLGAVIAATMSGGFAVQLVDLGRAGILVGSWMHVLGLAAGIGAAARMLLHTGRSIHEH